MTVLNGEKYRIIQGDCLEVMTEMPDNTFDILLTSPPYNVGVKYSEYDDNREEEEFLVWLQRVYMEMYRVTADKGRAYVVLSDRLMFVSKPMLEQAGYMFAQVLTWCKPNLTNTQRISGDWNFTTEQILLMRKGKKTAMLNGVGNTHSYFVIPTPQSNFKEGRYHPAQFPIALTTRILSRTPGEMVLDLFCGAGSTGIGCAKTGKKFVGIDVSGIDCEIARKRVGQAYDQPLLFAEIRHEQGEML